MDPKKCACVAVCEFQSGIQCDHIGGYPCCIRTCLDPNMIKLYALDVDLGLHGPTSPPKDKREEGEENQKPNNEREKVAPTWKPVMVIIPLKKPFFFNNIDLLPRLKTMAMVLLREARGRGVARVRRGSRGAENGRGVKRRRCGFLAVVRISRGRLNVVKRTAWRGARGGRRGEACYL